MMRKAKSKKSRLETVLSTTATGKWELVVKIERDGYFMRHTLDADDKAALLKALLSSGEVSFK